MSNNAAALPPLAQPPAPPESGGVYGGGKVESPWRILLRQLARNRVALAGFVFILPSLYRLKLFKVEWLEYVKIAVTSALILLVTVVAETYTGYKLSFFPLYLVTGLVTGIVSVKLLRVFKEEDYNVMMDFMPKRFRDIASRVWTVLRLPVQNSL